MANHAVSSAWVSFIFIILQIIATSFAQSDNFIVYMDLSAMPKAFSTQHTWYSATLQSLSQEDNPFSSDKLLYSYSHVIDGFSAVLTPSELDGLKNSPGYVSSIRDLSVKPDTTHSSKFLGLSSDSGAWPVSNFGRDVIIGLVDTGVWPESESFYDHGMSEIPSRWKGKCDSGTQFNSSLCNRKLVGARFYNKGLLARNPNATISMNSTRDTEGHGTHTSSTAAGNYVEGASYFGYAVGTARGMAPMARVAMYKAIWEEGAYASDIIAAIDQAIIDGVDVLSLSFGLNGLRLYEDPVALAAFSAVDRNIFVSTSAGNDGPYYETLHNGAPWVLTVAAGTMDREVGASLTLGDGVSLTGASLYPGTNSTSRSSLIPIVFMDRCNSSTELKKVGKKIVVCQDKNGSISGQIDSIRDAKVPGGIFISDDNDLGFFLDSSFPAIFMKSENGEIVKDYIQKNSDAKASMEFRKTETGTKPAPRVASYSSRGPSQSCPVVLKPDVMAPGDLILAAWPPTVKATRIKSRSLFTKFNLISGTSMACPHAAGIAALLKGAHPDWSPAAIRSAMMTTSDSDDNTNSPIKDLGDNLKSATPLAMGAGHINPNKALDPGLVYDATRDDYVSLLCAMNFTMKQIRSITKSSSVSCTEPSMDLNYPSFIAFFDAKNSRTVREFRRTVTNVGEGMSTYDVNVTPLKGYKVSVNPSKLAFRSKNEKQSYKVTLEGPAKMEESGVAFGYLSWAEVGGNHVVKSPIVAMTIIP